MDILERIWEILQAVGGGFMGSFERAITSLFGSANARYLKKLNPKVAAINALEEKMKALSDEQLREKTTEFRKRLKEGETLDDLLVEAFAVARESGRRYLSMRHYDVQLIGGMILHEGNIAEMVTGEGKTLVATLPAYLNGLSGKGVHVVTVNDYLARRDMEWMGPLYMNLGLTVGAIQSGMSSGARQEAYACDITYGTNNEFGFDYLRDNMRIAARGDDRYPKHEQQAQGPLNFAIVDEVDNILIDEARTPLIISGPAEDDVTKYMKADKIARQLKKDLHFEIKEKEHSANMTDEGVREAEKLAGVESFFTAGNMQWPHLLDNALKAHHLYKRDVNYVVQNGEVVIVDEFTGRLMAGRQWSDGLHQAVEAKEGVRVKEENQTLATITLQNFFKLYKKISGMTGTAMTEAGEFWKIYKLEVIAVPTNRGLQREEHPDVIYRTEQEKFRAIADEIERMNRFDTLALSDKRIVKGHIKKEMADAYEFEDADTRKHETIPKSNVIEIERAGRPILVGTVSIEKSERLSAALEKRGIKHEVLNAKHHSREAEIVAQAGRRGRVTIATNMAGRGTDIVLGGNPETMAWALLQDKYPTRLEVPDEEWNKLVDEIEQRENMKAEGNELKKLGGLHIIGTERHEARRIDLQLRGRCGRQGDPGSSRFYLSLEDDLMRIFAGEWVKNMLTRLGMQEGEAIESRMVSRRIEGAQKKVEERHFEARKSLLEYDEVMDEQRKRVYGYRQQILDGQNCRDLIAEMISDEIDRVMKNYLAADYGTSSFALDAGRRLGVELDPRDYRSVDFDTAERMAREEATKMAETQVLDAIDENLPESEDPDEWAWEALAKTLTVRWNMAHRDRDLKKIGRDELGEVLIVEARAAIDKIDLSECRKYLEPGYGVNSACDWLKQKFDIDLDRAEVAKLEPSAILKLAHQKAGEAYDRREAEFPIMVGLNRFSQRDASGARYDRDQFVAWAADRFHANLSLDDLKNKQRDEVKAALYELSRANSIKGNQVLDDAMHKVDDLFSGAGPEDTVKDVGRTAELQKLVDWLHETVEGTLTTEALEPLTKHHLEQKVTMTVEEYFRPEMRRLERALVLQLLDTAWKEHLLTMDHLRSSVGLRGYAQVDPKVEYKREGMRMFEDMWKSLGDAVTNLIFRMEQLDETFVGSTWKESAAVHESPPSVSFELPEDEGGVPGESRTKGSDEKLEPIRNMDDRVGRNQLCPCGSGKKYKQCCMKKDSSVRV